MINLITRNIIGFFLLLGLQALVVNNLDLGAWLNPYPYILFVMVLPFETPRWLVIPVSFLFGILLDAFSNTLGLHASVCVLMAFLRPRILQLLAPRDGYEFGTYPHVYSLGLGWFLPYAITMVLIHHLFFFFLEAFSFAAFWFTLGRAFSSAFLTLFLILLIEFLTARRIKT